MRRRIRSSLLPVAVLALSGCFRMTIDASALEPHVYLTPQAVGEVERVADFEARETASWLFFGFVRLSDAEIDEVLAREIARAQGDGVINLEIRTQKRFVDSLLQILTLGIYGQRTAFVEGTVVRRRAGGRR